MQKPLAVMQGRVCVVTGANRGIGKATAEGLARRGATTILLCRSRERGEAARNAIARVVGRKRDVALVIGDLADLASVRRAAEVIGRFGRLDVLVNNAGVYTRRREVTVDGLERVLQVNVLGPFLLTRLLQDRLVASSPSRIVNVAGVYHRKGRIDFDDLQGERDWSPGRAICQAQLARVMLTREWSRRLTGQGVVANCLHPGAVLTRGLHNAPWWAQLLAYTVALPLFVWPRKGARTSVWLASAPEMEQETGGYYERQRKAESAPAALDETAARRLWTACERLTGLA